MGVYRVWRKRINAFRMENIAKNIWTDEKCWKRIRNKDKQRTVFNDPNTVATLKSSRIRWAERVCGQHIRIATKWRPDKSRPNGRPRQQWEDLVSTWRERREIVEATMGWNGPKWNKKYTHMFLQKNVNKNLLSSWNSPLANPSFRRRLIDSEQIHYPCNGADNLPCLQRRYCFSGRLFKTHCREQTFTLGITQRITTVSVLHGGCVGSAIRTKRDTSNAINGTVTLMGKMWAFVEKPYNA